MRFKQFINESSNQDVTLEEASEWIKSNSRTLLDQITNNPDPMLLYRGGYFPFKEAAKIDASSSVRKSANTTNEYTLMIDSSPEWADFPKRSKSTICTSKLSYAKEYGKAYMVFPKDDTNMGCAAKSDFWNAFPFVKEIPFVSSLDDLNSFISSVVYQTLGEETHQDNADKLRAQLRSITKEKLQNKYKSKDQRRLAEAQQALNRTKTENIEQLIDKVLNPDENGPHTFFFDSWEDYWMGNSEYWFSGECVMVPVDMKDKLIAELEK